MMKTLISSFIKSIGIILVCAVAGVVLLMGAMAFPELSIKENAYEAAVVFSEEGSYPEVDTYSYAHLDNWTDSIMILNCIYEGEESLLQRALKMPYLRAKVGDVGLNPCESLVAFHGLGETGLTTYTVEYARYWHGYMLFVKPLLSLMDYSAIRVLNSCVQMALVAAVLLLMWKKGLKKLILPYIFMVLSLNPYVIGQSLQFSSVYYIANVAALVLLISYRHWTKPQPYIYSFLLIGAATSYFDFLTFPLITLAIPLVIYIAMDEDQSFKDMLFKLVIMSAFWGMGYIGMWAMKWVIASVLTDQNIIQDALNAIFSRTSKVAQAGKGFRYLDVFRANIVPFLDNLSIYPAAAFVAVGGILSLFRNKWNYVKYIFIYGCIAVIPFAWYVFASNHSYIHCFFTNKELAVSLFAVCVLAAGPIAQGTHQKRIE